MAEEQLEGIWSYIYLEEQGREISREQLAGMAKVVLLVGEYLSGWDGLWAVVDYGHEGGAWTEEDVKASCRHTILGGDREGEAPGSDFHFWAGGRFRVAPHRSPKEMDLEQFWRGQVLPSFQQWIYSIDDGLLTLCEVTAGDPRPTAFVSRADPNQHLGRLTRTPACRPSPGIRQ